MDPVTVWVDAFTDAPFAGNPAVVVLLDRAREDAWMGALAREMGVSETAFVAPRNAAAGGPDTFDLRWFTPEVEVDLCGHATLASAHVLWEEGRVAPGARIRFHTRSGLLGAAQQGPWIELDFPAAPAVVEPAPEGLAGALGAVLRWTGRGSLDDWLVELDDERTVRELAPDMAGLSRVPARGICVTARADGAGYDFVSRFFAPAVGIAEDPVTGSAHCMLAPYWSERLGREELVGFQASPRGGVVRVRSAGERVVLGGRAVTVLRGVLQVKEET